jgi:transmembrane sensor
MILRTGSNKTLIAAAARWNVRLDGEELSESERAAFQRWVQSPRHAKEFERQRALLAMIEELPSELKADIERSTFSTEAQRNTSKSMGARLSAHPWRLCAAAAVLALVVIMVPWHGATVYTSKTGEIRTLTLPDGSVASLNTGSQLKWVSTSHDRRVWLQEGEVFFNVVHDERRPFRILVGQSEIRDLGTQFDVYRKRSGSVVVTVINGSVDVNCLQDVGCARPSWHATLTTNQQIEYTSTGRPNIRSVVARESIDWVQGMLRFKGASLPSVVSELSRYTTKPIIMSDASLNNIRIGGAFDVRQVSQAIFVLSGLAPITVTETGGAFILTRRSDLPPVTREKEVHRP